MKWKKQIVRNYRPHITHNVNTISFNKIVSFEFNRHEMSCQVFRHGEIIVKYTGETPEELDHQIIQNFYKEIGLPPAHNLQSIKQWRIEKPEVIGIKINSW